MDGVSICLSVCLSVFLITVNLINFTLGKCIDEDLRKYSAEFKLLRSTGYICCVFLLPEVHTVLANERGPLLTIVLQNGKLGAARLLQHMQEQMKKDRPERLEMLHSSKLVSLHFVSLSSNIFSISNVTLGMNDFVSSNSLVPNS